MPSVSKLNSHKRSTLISSATSALWPKSRGAESRAVSFCWRSVRHCRQTIRLRKEVSDDLYGTMRYVSNSGSSDAGQEWTQLHAINQTVGANWFCFVNRLAVTAGTTTHMDGSFRFSVQPAVSHDPAALNMPDLNVPAQAIGIWAKPYLRRIYEVKPGIISGRLAQDMRGAIESTRDLRGPAFERLDPFPAGPWRKNTA